MNFSFTEEQKQFREVVSRFFHDKSPTSTVRELMKSPIGYDPVVWKQLCDELGLAGIHIPEAYAGSGFGPVELGIVMEEQGKTLLCAPYFASPVMAGYAILIAGTVEQKQSLLPNIANGNTIAALAITEQKGAWDEDDIKLSATESEGHYVLNGRKRFILEGGNAQLLVVAGRTKKGVSLFTVDISEAQDISITPREAMDETRKIFEIEFNKTKAYLLGEEGNAKLPEIYDAILVAFSNEMIGGAQALLDATLEFIKMRVQFGRSIGSFQAIKHRCADLYLEVELAKAAVYQAAEKLSTGESATDIASLAKAVASETFLKAAAECIQLHGGVGFTWENDTHLWFKRAKSSEVFLGTPDFHRERMLRARGI